MIDHDDKIVNDSTKIVGAMIGAQRCLCVVSDTAERTVEGRSCVPVVAHLIEQGWTVLIIVPCDGALIADFESVGARVKQCCYRRWTLQFPSDVEDSVADGKRLAEALADERIDLFYTNTSVVNAGALAAAIMDTPHIWHVRKFLREGIIPMREIARFIRDVSNSVIFSSAAVRDSYLGGEDWPHSRVIYDYFDLPPWPQNKPSSTECQVLVDIIVPFYNDPTTLACLESIVRNLSNCVNDVLVISDVGPDKALATKVREFVECHPGTLRWLENKTNQGFVVTCNRGMRESANDVILLNSDTVVTLNWVEKLKAVAYSDECIATVTPLSNNASIFSVVPEPLQATENNADELCEVLELLAGDIAIDVPTAHGFCMYIKRAALNDVGLFDAETFGRGNGEENDFSLRARRRGWRNVVSTRTYVYHRGARSFGTVEKQALVRRHVEIIHSRYPEYRGLLDEFSSQDPFGDIRQLLPHFVTSNALQKGPNLLVLGALLPQERQLDAVQALGFLAVQGTRPQLLLAGAIDKKPDYVEEIQRAAKSEGVSEQIHIIGDVRDPRPLLGISDVVLVCSDHEPTGRAAVEAMLFRRPVVASRAGSIPEIVRHEETGLLYPPGDAGALAEALAYLLREKPEMLRQFGEQGHTVASSAYDLKTYRQGILEVIESERGQYNPGSGMAAYLCEISRLTVRATPLPEIIRERIIFPLKLRLNVWLSSARVAVINLSRKVIKVGRT